MQIVPFNFDGGEIRVITRDGEPWFVLADVCRVLEIANTTQAASRLDADEAMTLSLAEGHSGQRGGAQNIIVISEAGLYRLVMRSDKPQAKPFQKWVTSEVLPSIRKTGGYGKQDPMALLNDAAALGSFLYIGVMPWRAPL